MCPEILADLPDGYAMEVLDPAFVYPTLLLEIESLLHESLWTKTFVAYRDDWFYHLTKITELRHLPNPPPMSGDGCLTHGDCTVSNAMRRPGTGGLVLVDPLPQSSRPHVARCREADMGRILQSALGWEVLRYGDEPTDWEPPRFWFRDAERRAALWWCGCTAARISIFGQPEQPVLDWCKWTQEVCFDAVGI